MAKYFFLFITLIFLTNTHFATAQSKAFEKISFGASVGNTIAGDEFLTSWDSQPSLQLEFRTPFYAGDLEAGARYARFSNSPEFPDFSSFDSYFIYMGWAYAFAITDWLTAGPGLRFGTTFFQYDEAKIYTRPNANWEYDSDTSESEFAYELIFRSNVRISKHFSAHAELTYNRTLTFHPINLNYITAGFTYTLDAPGWLKKVFR